MKIKSIQIISIVLIFFLLLYCKKEDLDDIKEVSVITDYDGNTYKTLKLGNQWWMAENLNTTHYADGSEINLVENSANWYSLSYEEKAYCYYNNNENGEKNIYGALYSWAAAMNGSSASNYNPSGVQGVCPDGWHLPSDNEWKELEMYLGMSESETNEVLYRGTNEGSKLAGNKNTWVNGYLKNDTTFDESGFTAVGGGYRDYYGTFHNLTATAVFISSTDTLNWSMWYRGLMYNNTKIDRHYGITGANKKYGFSVRCVKDK